MRDDRVDRGDLDAAGVKAVTPTLRYPIRAVAQMTGLSIDTLRAWERRYGAVVPGRGDRGRLYTDADIARLRQLSDLVSRGHAIGSVATLSGGELDRLLKKSQASVREPATAGPVASAAAVVEALDRYEVETLERTLNQYAVVLQPDELVFAVVLPLLQIIGERWASGQLRSAQEHVVSASVRSVLGALLRTTSRGAAPKVLFAAPSGERHELGLLCAALLAASAGYGVIYLGADLPADEIRHAALTAGVAAVVIALTTPGAVAAQQLKTLAGFPSDVHLLVGGPASQQLLALGSGRAIPALSELVAGLRDVCSPV